MIEIKGKNGDVLRFELIQTTTVQYRFYYKNNGISYMCKDDDCDVNRLQDFQHSLGDLLRKNHKPVVDEILNNKPDFCFLGKLRNRISSWWSKVPSNDEVDCVFSFLYIDAFLGCKRVKYSSDYVFEFEFYDPYRTYDADDEEAMVIRGSLLVTRAALWDYHQALLSL